jgi:CspA family cold shock protein
MKGKIKWFNPRKGYGFISGDDGQDVFLHHTSIPSGVTIVDGDILEYDVEIRQKGPSAINIKKLEGE